ncbi:hypothetical protein, partial [Solemya velum gill symbiont]|uniref:hypothetical protein n=1 Tax=Solemya velum gill symbiont TaxID=2340 RepID=UPI00117B5434
LLLGDFNGTNQLWSASNNPRGDLIENFLTNNNLCLFNDKSLSFPYSGHVHFFYFRPVLIFGLRMVCRE